MRAIRCKCPHGEQQINGKQAEENHRKILQIRRRPVESLPIRHREKDKADGKKRKQTLIQITLISQKPPPQKIADEQQEEVAEPGQKSKVYMMSELELRGLNEMFKDDLVLDGLRGRNI